MQQSRAPASWVRDNFNLAYSSYCGDIPEQLRGLGHVRDGNMAAVMVRCKKLRRELESPGLRGTDPMRIVEPVAA